jgi:hypothetical protein
MILIPVNLNDFFVDVESEPSGIDAGGIEVVVLGRVAMGGFDDAASGSKGSVDLVLGVVDEREESDGAKPAGGGLDGSEGCGCDDDLDEPSCRWSARPSSRSLASASAICSFVLLRKNMRINDEAVTQAGKEIPRVLTAL